MLKVLCICTEGLNRSKLCAEYLKTLGYETKYKGVSETSENKVTKEDIEWADIIIFLKPKHLRLFLKKFRFVDKPMIVLNINDIPSDIKRNLKKGEIEKLYEKFVLKEIKEQIGRYLPLEDYIQQWFD